MFLEAPVWARNFERLTAAGVTGDRVRVLLYFDVDPTGYWDFAKACGPSLPKVFAERRVDAEALASLRLYAETWMGCTVSRGRLAPMPAFTVRDYAQLAEANLPAISRVMRALADDESRATYSRIIYGTNEDLFAAFVEKVFGLQQYMEIVNLDPGDVVVNCGVGRGWEIPYFLCRTRGQGRIFNFDPNIVWKSTRYGDLIERFQDRLVEREIILSDHDGHVDMPVSNANMVRSDDVGQLMAAHGVPTERYVSARLDTLAAEGVFDRLDYLKMDVEGGERSILNGAFETIRRFRPKLAIAIYHEPQHFWEYPQMLMDRLEGYRYYIRQYGYSRFETLLYAVPDEDQTSRSHQEGLRNPARGRAARSAPRLLCHLRDAAPRADYYGGGRQMLTRVQGADWATASIDPAPLIDTDDIIGVFEAGSVTHYIATHDFGAGGRQIAIARSDQRATLEWIATQGIDGFALCVPAPGPAGEVGYAIHIPETGMLSVYGMVDGAPQGLASLATAGVPRLVQRSPEGFLVITAAPDASRIESQVFNASGGSIGDPASITLPGPLRGAMAAEADGPGGGWAITLAVEIRTDDAATLSAVDLSGRVLGHIPLDAKFRAIPTFRTPARALG